MRMLLPLLLLHTSNAPKVAQQRIHVDLLRRSGVLCRSRGGSVRMCGRRLLLLLLLLLWRLEGGEERVQGCVV